MRLERTEIDAFNNIPREDTYQRGISLALGENCNSKVSKVVKDAIIKELGSISLYPDALQIKARERIAKYSGVSKDQIILGNGIDGLLVLIAVTFIDKGDEVITVNPTFDGYEKVTKLMGGVVKKVNLDQEFHLDLSNVEQNITDRTKTIFIANPNNPTGNILLTNKEAEQILTRFKGLLVIDECYYGICNKSVIRLVNRYPRLLITRSFSKSLALAGLRVGYAIGGERVIGELRKVSYHICPFEVDRLAQSSTIILEYPQEVHREIESFRRRKVDFQELLRETSLEVIPTETSFVLLDLKRSAKVGSEVRNELMEKGIFVKMTRCREFDDRYITMGVPKEVDVPRVIAALREMLEN